MAKKEKYVFTKKKQPIFWIFKLILRIVVRKPKIINLNEKIPDDGLIIAPHQNKFGPLYMSMFFPTKIAFIGAYPMLGNYKDRYIYLRNVLYIQKNHRGKFSSTLKAGFEAIFSKMVYKGMHLIPSYPDLRFVNTINYSCKTIENGLPVVVFPEDSENGYKEIMQGFHPGFIKICETYNRRYNKDIPIYPMYQLKKKRLFVIDKPFYLSELSNMSNEEICRYSEDRINKLYEEYFK